MTMNEVVLESQDLTKHYGDFVAVDSLNLAVRRGEVFGLLGPNGAGKTTTILMLLGLTEPTAGSVQVLGLSPMRQPLRVKARVGYLPDQVGFYDGLTARENLIYIAKLNGLSRNDARARIDAALAQMGIAAVADKRVGAFSRGMRQRLGLAEILLKRPELIIMDEPTLGLDPEAAREFLQIIQGLKADGITVLLSSHLLHQVQVVCDRVGLFHRGRLALEGAVSELARRVLDGAYRIYLEAEGPAGLEDVLQRLDGVVSLQRAGRSGYDLEATHDLRAEAAQVVVEAGGRLLALQIETPSLDEIYTRYFKEVEHGVTA
jgi:ABC-2 type transport system ATP-binding protein